MPTRASTFRIGEVATILGASADTVRRLADTGKLRTRRTAAGHRVVAGAELARFLVTNLGAPEADVIVARSARNRFPGIVTRVVKDKVAAQVEIHAGPHRIVSLMTREAADELGLAPGVRAVAAVKATNVVIELPGSRSKNT
ncbi:MAG: helix-turn-helix transcriptional regulator [Deltaproteobacteria bacterium]|nr:helix-turn-helix transcriptional regulator [Deltaproteobacteria bacterium]